MKLALLLITAMACSRNASDTAPHSAATRAPAVPSSPSAPATGAVRVAPGPSIYDLAVSLQAADDRAITLDADRGYPTLISMFYGSCAMACPALIGYLRQVLETAPAETRVMLVSFDAARDTPAHLRELAATHRLDGRWTLASASPSDARSLAAVLGVKYRAMANGEFVHNSVIVVLDGDGMPVARQHGLGAPGPLVEALQTVH